MTQEQKDTYRQQMHELLDLVLDINGCEERTFEKTHFKPTAFFSYAGHTNGVNIDIHSFGWNHDGADFHISTDPESHSKSYYERIGLHYGNMTVEEAIEEMKKQKEELCHDESEEA